MMKFKRASRFLAGIVAVGFMTACAAPEHNAGSYQMQHKIRVTEEVVSVHLSVPASSGRLLQEEENGFKRFVRIFQLRGQSPVTVYVDESKADGLPRAAVVRRFVSASANAGIRSDSIQVMPGSLGHEGDAPILAVFNAHAADAPECGNWDGKSAYRWANLRHEDFGCSYQRNLALSVANPNDFIEQQPMSAYGAQRGIVNVISVETGATAGDAGTAAQ